MIVHFGYNGADSQEFIRRYAKDEGKPYRFVGIHDDFWKSADIVKRASLVFIWNGRQHSSPLAAELCRSRGIPHCFFEWGMMPQSSTFFVDPRGLHDRSVLMDSLAWVSESDIKTMLEVRSSLQAEHPLKPNGSVLVPLQIENDTSILYTTPYTTMADFIDDIGRMFPNQDIVIRPHPKSKAVRKSRNPRHTIERAGDFLPAAARASAVVGLTSTTLTEAAILGVPTFALGDCPMRRHRSSDRLLAGYWALRVPRSGSPREVLERFNVRPL